jgi:gamma-D-glutamyl-L-lysine dipeptidyl-peptidase
MKFIIFGTAVIVTFLLSCHPASVELLQREIDDISKHWVPDNRVSICNLLVVNGEGKNLVLKGESLIPEAKDEVLQLLRDKGLSVTDSSVILPDSIKLLKNWGLISLSVANLRSKPAHSAELVSQAIMGTPVRVLKEDGGWILIQTPDRYISWTNESSVQKMGRHEITGWRNANRIIYTGTDGTIFGNRNLTTVISDLVAGSIVIKKSEVRDVTEVILPDGRLGYVENLNWLNFKQWKDTVSLIGDNMIATGERFLGFPYLWGGTSSKAMDCSGFVKTVCFLNGVILERDASQQFNHGLKIDISSGWGNLQKGDLLFFGSKQPFRVVHVGMYIGDSEVINASGMIRIISLDKKRTNFSNSLSSTLLGSKRIIGFAPEQGYWPVKLHNWYN